MKPRHEARTRIAHSLAHAFAPWSIVVLPTSACAGREAGLEGPPDSGDDAQTDDRDGGVESGPVDAAPDVDNGAPSTTYPAPHSPLPQVLSGGGPTLSKPKLYLIFYPGYPYETQLQTFAKSIGGSTYWAATTSEYGVGTIEYAGTLDLTGQTAPASIEIDQVEAFIDAELSSGALGAVDSNTIYTIFYPESTTITVGGQPASCVSFGGYHMDTIVGGTDVAYAVLPT